MREHIYSGHVPGMAYFLLTILSLLVLFALVSIVNNWSNQTIGGISGMVISENNSENDSSQQYYQIDFDNESNNLNSEYKKPEFYQMKSKMVYYLMLIGVIASILIVGVILRSTLRDKIHKESEPRF